MQTLRQIQSGKLQVPLQVSWLLSDLGERVGKQELFTRQSPQCLKVLRENAIVQSAVSSNRIEGVVIDRKRVETVVFGTPHLRDRGEEEIAGYRNALEWIHRDHGAIDLDEGCLLRLHELSRGESWDAGAYKEKPVDIIETAADGSSRVRFRSVSPEDTPKQTREMLSIWNDLRRERRVAGPVLLAALNLDFLCIHPFRDGNGRVSRLLLLLSCYQAGMDVGRYISLERLIEEHKERYYETLEQSSQGWHEGAHDPWPYIGFVLYILQQAYKELEERADLVQNPKVLTGQLSGHSDADDPINDLIRLIAENPEGSYADYAQRLNVSESTVKRRLQTLKHQSKIERMGSKKNGYWRIK